MAADRNLDCVFNANAFELVSVLTTRFYLDLAGKLPTEQHQARYVGLGLLLDARDFAFL